MSDRIALNILRAVISNFDSRLLPALNDNTSKIYGGLISHALKFLEGRLEHAESALDDRRRARDNWLLEVSSLLGVGAESIAPDSKAGERFSILLQMASDTGADAPRARQLLAASVQAEASYLAAIDQECFGGGGASFRGGRQEKAAASPNACDLTVQALARWGAERWPEARDGEIIDLVAMPGGFSKTTAFFTLRSRRGDRRLALRRDLPTPLMGQTVVDEYPLLIRLHGAGFPVAKPLVAEPMREFINGAFMVSERLQGSVDFTAWKDHRQSVLAIGRQFAELLARLHNSDLGQLGISTASASRSAYDCMRIEIDRWYQLYRSKTREQQPLLELAFAWLSANIPEDLKGRPARLLHGDAGFHNLLVDEGRINALLDWEFHHLGDPVEDLCYARQFIEQVMSWEEFMGFYLAAGGVSYPQDDEFFSVWTATRNPSGCVDSVALFETVVPNEMQLAVAGYIFGPRLQVDAARKTLDVLETATRRSVPEARN